MNVEDNLPAAAPNDAEVAGSRHPAGELVEAIERLHIINPELAASLISLFSAISIEAGKSKRFASSLGKSMGRPSPIIDQTSLRSPDAITARTKAGARPRNRRPQGIIDPFAIFSEGGETDLRSGLSKLTLDQLRDIVAEHGMDTDRLAMKWKEPARVVDRIVERVEARLAKGSAFREHRP